MTWKERYQRFRAWQQRPFSYELKSDELQHCMCCGRDFTGNYCPYCAQAAGTKRLTWKSSFQAMMGIWDLENRSFFSTLLQLLFRPGHLIADYWDGRRQSSFPPVKMLFFLGIIMSVLTLSFEGVEATDWDAMELGNTKDMIKNTSEWLETNQGWTMLIFSALMMVPTWFLFRFSPRHPKHTMPEGFFLQVFNNCILLVFLILAEIITIIFDNEPLDQTFGIGICFVIMPIYLFFIYKHLFGYGVWNILWRFVLILATAIVNFFALVFFAGAILMPRIYKEPKYLIGFLVLGFCVVAFSALLIAGGYVIGYSKHRDKQLINTNK